MKLDHIGYLTNDIDETAKAFVALGYTQHETYDFDAQKCSVCFLTKGKETRIELVKPYEENKSLQRILKKTGVAPYHMCYLVDDVDEEIAKPQYEGFVPLFAPIEAPAFNNRKICYLWNQEIGFIELVNMDIKEFVNKCKSGGVIYEVSPEIYFAFQRCSSDFNPLHTDEAYAEAHGFASRVMYGNILNAFVSHFVGMKLPTRDVIIQSQDINYRKPVFLHDKLELQYAIENVSEAANSITFKLKFYKQADVKPMLVANGHVSIGLLN